MADLINLSNPGAAVGDTYNEALEIPASGVLASTDYVWQPIAPETLATYAAGLLPAQSTMRTYAAPLLPAQPNLLTVSGATALTAGGTGVNAADLKGSSTFNNGLYLQRQGTFVPAELTPVKPIEYTLLAFNTALPANSSFNFNVTKPGAAPHWDFDDGTATIRSASGSQTVTGPSPRKACMRVRKSEVSAITTLSLDSNQITLMPGSIGALTGLLNLSMQVNRLPSLPPTISGMTSLQAFSLSDNLITSIPPEIGNLTTLTSLNLNNNLLPSLPAALGSLTNLQSLSINNNALTALPAALAGLPNLSAFDVTGNQLTGAAISTFAQLIAANPAWNNCTTFLHSNPGDNDALADPAYIAAKATLVSRGCTVLP